MALCSIKSSLLAKEGKTAEAIALLQGDAGKASREEQNAIAKMMEAKIKLARRLLSENTATPTGPPSS